MENKYDVVVVGGGPAGLSAAINVVARGRKPIVIKAGESNLEKAELINNHLGFFNMSGKEMQKRFQEHAEALGVEIIESKVSNILPMGNSFIINISGNIVSAGAVILAIGSGRASVIQGERELLGMGVSNCATCDGMLFRGKSVVVAGNSDDLIEEAEFLKSVGVDVTLVSRKEYAYTEIDGMKHFADEVEEIVAGDMGYVKAVRLASGKELETDGVFLLRNMIAPDVLVNNLKMESGRIHVGSDMATNVDGVFACGDCTGLPLQISNAVGDGMIAGQNAAKYLDRIEY